VSTLGGFLFTLVNLLGHSRGSNLSGHDESHYLCLLQIENSTNFADYVVPSVVIQSIDVGRADVYKCRGNSSGRNLEHHFRCSSFAF
jgi:hypothetical protein